MIVVLKGETDAALFKDKAYIVSQQGSKKRCGGIGDVLSGCLATTMAWDR